MTRPTQIEPPQPDKAPASIRAMFGAIAPTYDLLNRLLSMGIDRLWRRTVARHAVAPTDRRILDVCCGTGDLTIALAARANSLGATAALVGADFTRRMVELANAKTAQPNSGIHNLLSDTLRLPFPAGAFDLVTVAFGIRNVADWRAGLAEMARVCRPGGRVAVLEFSRPPGGVLGPAYGFYFRRILPAVGRLVSGTGAYSYLRDSVVVFPEGAEFADAMSAIIGAPVERHAMAFRIATLYLARLPDRAP